MIDSHYALMPIPLSQLQIGLVTQYVLEKLFTSVRIVHSCTCWGQGEQLAPPSFQNLGKI